MKKLAPLAIGVALAAACSGAQDSLDTPNASSRGANERTSETESPNNPGTPTNQGAPFNQAGYSAIAPILNKHCSECHHAGTWLDLERGADATVATRVVATIEGGSMPPAPRQKVAQQDVLRLKSWRDQAPIAAGATAAPEISQLALPQLLSAQNLARYTSTLPKVAYERLNAILKSPATLFYDKQVVPPAYQDTVGDGSSLPFGARFNSTGASLIVPQGRKLFAADGSTWAFPFGHTAGTDESQNTLIVNFLYLPESEGVRRPIVYKIESAQQSGFPTRRWTWSYPVGTMMGEVIMIRDGQALLTTEIRIRERFENSWSTNAFRPFPTAQGLAAAVKQRQPGWSAKPALANLIAKLETNATVVHGESRSPAFDNMITLAGGVDEALPAFGDDDLVRDLLKTTTFTSAYGVKWKSTGDEHSFGATGPQVGLSIVPTRYQAGLLEVRESTCTKCHDQGGTFIGDLVSDAVLYGEVWGVDRIFSLHPFEPSRIDASGRENRSVRAGLSSVFVSYDASVHGDYTFYRAPAR
jgi:hypothetical protein